MSQITSYTPKENSSISIVPWILILHYANIMTFSDVLDVFRS